jgi:pseudo-rSAM protein
MKYLQSTDANLMFHFVVEKEEDVEVIEGLIAGYSLKDMEFHPYFNGENLSFFKNNIFITRESLVEAKPSMRNIFANTNINFLNFRQLTVMSDRCVFANLNHSSIGRLGEDSIPDILKKELKMGKSWGRIRKNVIPCKSCAYNALCPPITNYEYVIGKYNLCNIT